MILLTLGTDEHPFERALDLVGELEVEELVVQHGHTPPRLERPRTTWLQFAPFEGLRGLMLAADVVVCHAGVGSIITALSCGRTPVVIARRSHLGEHVDDHQLEIVAELGARRLVVPCAGADELAAACVTAQVRPAEWRARSHLHAAVKLASAA